MSPTRYERMVDRTPTWLIAVILFSPGWVYVIAFGGKWLGWW